MYKNFLLVYVKENSQYVEWYSTEEEILKRIEEIKKITAFFEAYDLKVNKVYQIDDFKFI